MQPIFFQKAGKLMLTKYVNGVPVRSAETSYFRNGAVESITPSVTINSTSLPDGNSDWAAAQPDTGKEGTVAISLSFMPLDLYAFLMGVEVEDLTSEPFPIIDHEITIPEASPFTVTLPQEPDTGRPIILVDADASAWVKTGSSPAQGQYSISAAVATFNSADAGKSVFITYDYTAAVVKSFGLPKSGSRPAMECVISGEATGEDESEFFDAAIIIDRCKSTGNINPPPMSRNPQPQTITLQVLKPRGNKKAVDFRFAKKS
jgi:hypothetical protein